MITRYGGQKFWEYMADAFHEKLRTDSLLRGFFERRTENEASMINFNILRAGFGDEQPYYEEAIIDAHKDKNISIDHVNRFLNCLRNALTEEGVEDEDVLLIISRISKYGDLIISNSE